MGQRVLASDVDIGDPGGTDSLIYSITDGNDYASTSVFSIDAVTGQITVAAKSTSGNEGDADKCRDTKSDNCVLRFDEGSSSAPSKYVLTVMVQDTEMNTDTAQITISVVDTNFPPTIENGAFSILKIVKLVLSLVKLWVLRQTQNKQLHMKLPPQILHLAWIASQLRLSMRKESLVSSPMMCSPKASSQPRKKSIIYSDCHGN